MDEVPNHGPQRLKKFCGPLPTRCRLCRLSRTIRLRTVLSHLRFQPSGLTCCACNNRSAERMRRLPSFYRTFRLASPRLWQLRRNRFSVARVGADCRGRQAAVRLRDTHGVHSGSSEIGFVPVRDSGSAGERCGAERSHIGGLRTVTDSKACAD
jgi:hypothetical protein